MMNRREFVLSAAAAAAVGGKVFAEPAMPRDFAWGVLLHFGANMWGDGTINWADAPDSPEAEKDWGAKKPAGLSRAPIVRNYLRFDEGVWREATRRMQAGGLNMVLIDVGESLVYPSHPELAVKGSWSPERYRKELDRLRAMGLEPIPKLNFSAAHDAWLKEYHRRLCTPEYYRVCADVIRDVAEVFGRPRWFHIGFDEEMAEAMPDQYLAAYRQGDLWWHDFLYIVKEVEKHGSRAWIWSDYIWSHREEFLRRMPKSVLQSNWYYREKFGPEMLPWNEEAEKRGGWNGRLMGVSAFLELEKAGFDQVPCGSNFYCDENVEPLFRFCKEHISPARFKGFMTAPWMQSVPKDAEKLYRGIDQIVRVRA